MAKRSKRKNVPRPVRRPIPPPAPFWRLRLSSQYGQEILEEVKEDPALSFALWYAARRVRAWVEAGGERARAGKLMRPATSEALAEVGAAVAFLGRFSQSASAADVAVACSTIGEWAEAADLKETRLQFAELAARVEPDDPARANKAGRVCREAGLYDRAELWLERAYRYAARVGAQDEAVRALLGNGALMKQRGRLPQARRWFLKGARRARRTGRKRMAAEARHDLLTLAAERGDLVEVVHHASMAIELYPLNSPRLPYLAHDFAFVLVRMGLYSDALPLFDAFLKVIPPHELLPGISTFGWAAAGCGLVHRFEDAERRTLKRLHVDNHKAAAAFIHLAEGARLLGRWTQAGMYAARAGSAARERGQRDLEDEAAALLAAVESRTPANPPRPGDLVEMQALLRYFALRLRRWKGRPGGQVNRGPADRAAGGGT